MLHNNGDDITKLHKNQYDHAPKHPLLIKDTVLCRWGKKRPEEEKTYAETLLTQLSNLAAGTRKRKRCSQPISTARHEAYIYI
jgi:hypothetical protein